MPKLVSKLFSEYTLECSWKGCPGKRIVEYPMNGGWEVGMIVPEDSSHPDVGRCPMCKRHIMRVTKGPEKPPPPKPKGWNRVPTQ